MHPEELDLRVSINIYKLCSRRKIVGKKKRILNKETTVAGPDEQQTRRWRLLMLPPVDGSVRSNIIDDMFRKKNK